jgi:hypothetical protein
MWNSRKCVSSKYLPSDDIAMKKNDRRSTARAMEREWFV